MQGASGTRGAALRAHSHCAVPHVSDVGPGVTLRLSLYHSAIRMHPSIPAITAMHAVKRHSRLVTSDHISPCWNTTSAPAGLLTAVDKHSKHGLNKAEHGYFLCCAAALAPTGGLTCPL
jgi:hypothetical protein